MQQYQSLSRSPRNLLRHRSPIHASVCADARTPLAVEQGFVPTSPKTRHENGASLVYGCDFTHPDSQAKCSYRSKLVWDDGAGEDVVVEAHTVHDHPLDALDPLETRARTEKIVAELRIEQVRFGLASMWGWEWRSGQELTGRDVENTGQAMGTVLPAGSDLRPSNRGGRRARPASAPGGRLGRRQHPLNALARRQTSSRILRNVIFDLCEVLPCFHP